jgi:hypothetical protein
MAAVGMVTLIDQETKIAVTMYAIDARDAIAKDPARWAIEQST